MLPEMLDAGSSFACIEGYLAPQAANGQPTRNCKGSDHNHNFRQRHPAARHAEEKKRKRSALLPWSGGGRPLSAEVDPPPTILVARGAFGSPRLAPGLEVWLRPFRKPEPEVQLPTSQS